MSVMSQLLKFPMQSSTRYDTSLQRRKETSPREEEKQNASHQKVRITQKEADNAHAMEGVTVPS